MVSTLRTFFALLPFIFWGNFLWGQIPAPQLLCAAKDFGGDVELVWNLPDNCGDGDIQGYIIYASTVPELGFSVLDTVFNLAQTTYDHINAGAPTWYYFMQTYSSCTGVSLSSDTINTDIPIEPEIIAVTITDNGVLIIWAPGSSPETYAYLIEQETPNGFVVIDTVFGRFNTQYLHAVPTDGSSMGYLVRAIDACGRTSIISTNVHRTILIQGNLDACARTIHLEWSPYVGWNEIESHSIAVNLNNAGYQYIADLSSDQFSFPLNGLEDLDSLCIFIESTGDQEGNVSQSNRLCLLADVVNPMTFIRLYGVGYDENNQLVLSWQWDTGADITAYHILTGESPDNLSMQMSMPQTGDLASINPVSPGVTVPLTMQTYAALATTDECQAQALSATAQPAFLRVDALPGLVNRLQWTPPVSAYGTVEQYRIYRQTTAGYVLLATLPAPASTFDDQVNPVPEAEGAARYYVEAHMRIQLPDYPMFQYRALSNRVAAVREADILMPNAFSPEGNNPEFKPLAVYPGNLLNYRMEIYNRYGQQMFVSTHPQTGWTGTFKGKPMPPGTYVVLVNYVQADGRQQQYKGTFMLLR